MGKAPAKKMVMRYTAAAGAPFTQEEAPVVGAIFEGMDSRGIPVTAETVLDEAVPVASPIHKCFTWDDTQAAHQHRLHEARTVIRSLVIVADHSTDRGVRARHSVVVNDDIEDMARGRRTYVAVTEMQTDKSLRQQVVNDAVREVLQWRDKYRALGFDELQPVFGAVDNFVAAQR